MDEVRIQAIVQQIKFRIIKLKNIKRNEMHINDTLCAANLFSFIQVKVHCLALIYKSIFSSCK